MSQVAWAAWDAGADAAPQLRREAPALAAAAVVQMAVALLHAAHVMSPLLSGNPMRASIDPAIADLGLQGTELFHERLR